MQEAPCAATKVQPQAKHVQSTELQEATLDLLFTFKRHSQNPTNLDKRNKASLALSTQNVSNFINFRLCRLVLSVFFCGRFVATDTLVAGTLGGGSRLTGVVFFRLFVFIEWVGGAENRLMSVKVHVCDVFNVLGERFSVVWWSGYVTGKFSWAAGVAGL